MPISSSVVTSYYQAIMRATPTQAQVAALSTLTDTSALTNTLLGGANASVDPIIRVYQAAFGRVPDSGGLDYWVGVYNAGGNSVAALQAITAGFAGSMEFKNAYDGLNNSLFVSALYQNVLGRAGDASGVAYWTNLANNGVARSTILREFASSAEFTSRTDSAIDAFLSTAAAGTNTYSGSLLTFSSGSSFAMTTAADLITGTSGADTITGGLDTISASDEIKGGAGADRAEFRLINTAAANIAPVMSAVETIALNARGSGASFDFSNVVGVTGVTIEGFTATLSAMPMTASLALVNGFTGQVNVNIASGAVTADTLNLIVSSAASADVQAIDADTVTITVNQDTLGLGTASTFSAASSVSIVSTKNLSLSLWTAGTANTAGVFSNSSFQNMTSLSYLGGGALTLDASSAQFNVYASAGNDTVSFRGGLDAGQVISLGAGTDTLNAQILASGDINPTILGVETVNLNADAAWTASFSAGFGVSTLNLRAGATAAVVWNNIGSALRTINLESGAAGALFSALSTGGASDVVINVAVSTDTSFETASATVTGYQFDRLSYAGNSGSVNLNVIGSASLAVSTIDMTGFKSVTLSAGTEDIFVQTLLEVGTATTVKIVANSGMTASAKQLQGSAALGASLTIEAVGAASKVEIQTANGNWSNVTLNAGANGGTGANQVNISALNFNAMSASTGLFATSLTLNATGGDITIGNIGFNNSATAAGAATAVALNLTINASVGTASTAAVSGFGFATASPLGSGQSFAGVVQLNVNGSGQFSFAQTAAWHSAELFRVSLTGMSTGGYATVTLGSNQYQTTTANGSAITYTSVLNNALGSASFSAGPGYAYMQGGAWNDTFVFGLGTGVAVGGWGNDEYRMNNTAVQIVVAKISTAVALPTAGLLTALTASSGVALQGSDTVYGIGTGDVILAVGETYGLTATGGAATGAGTAAWLAQTTVSAVLTTSFTAISNSSLTAMTSIQNPFAVFTSNGNTIVQVLNGGGGLFSAGTAGGGIGTAQFSEYVVVGLDNGGFTATFSLNFYSANGVTGLALTLL